MPAQNMPIGVGNGTDALWLTFMAMGLGAGDELITNGNTFFATAEAMWIAGCTAVLVDCDADTRCIDPDAIRKAVTKRTKAIVPVHLYGQCAPMREIRKIADEHGLLVVEDNAQGIDARGDDFKVGELSDAVCMQLHHPEEPGHLGDGGAVWTNHQYINDRIRKLRNHGSGKRDVHSFGFNSRLDDLHAGILSAKLAHIRELERSPDRNRREVRRRPEGLRFHHAAARAPGLPPRLPPVRDRNEKSGRPRSDAGVPERRRSRRQNPLLDRDSQPGRVSVGPFRPPVGGA